MEHAEVERSKAFIIVEMLDYAPHSTVIKTIVRKTTGNISVVSCDSGEVLKEKNFSL